VLKLILQLGQVGNNALAFVGLLVVIDLYNSAVEIINGTGLEWSQIFSN
jgi:hypothetical protein